MMQRRRDLAIQLPKRDGDQDLAQRVEALEAAVYRLTAELNRFRRSATGPAPSSARSQRIVLEAITRRIEAGGGDARAATSEIAAEVSLHQTYVAAILKTLEAEGRMIAFGRRLRTYRLPSAANA